MERIVKAVSNKFQELNYEEDFNFEEAENLEDEIDIDIIKYSSLNTWLQDINDVYLKAEQVVDFLKGKKTDLTITFESLGEDNVSVNNHITLESNVLENMMKSKEILPFKFNVTWVDGLGDDDYYPMVEAKVELISPNEVFLQTV